MQKIKLFMVLALLCVGVSESWAETSTVTASRITSSSATWTGSQNESWAVTVNGGATNQTVTNSYAQVGTQQSPSTSITFSTSGISGTITSIVVDCAAYKGWATISATVGGSSFGTQDQRVPSWSNNSGGNVTFSGSASGDITITMTNGYVDWWGDRTGGRAMYIKSITVTYTIPEYDPTQDPRYLSWSEGNFTYSNYHIQSTNTTGDGSGKQGFMDDTFDYYPGQPEIAISLNLNKTNDNMTDVMYATVDGYLGNDGYIHNISGRPTVPQVNGTNLPTTQGSSTTINGITYTYLGDNYDRHGTSYWGPSGTYNGYNVYQRYYFYERSYSGKYSDVTSVTIPKEVTHDGVTYKVTAIQKWGFCYAQNDMNVRPSCSTYAQSTDAQGRTVMTYTDKPGESEKSNINDHSNEYLKTVTFEQYSNIHSVGDYAFMSCKALTSIQIPASVTYFGQGIFECCTALTDCRFQTLTSAMISYYNGLETTASTSDDTVIPLTESMVDQVRWSTLRIFTFWFCTALQSLELPDGITEIKGRGYGGPLQYLTSLINIRLPNTLTTIGEHFLCCAMSLKTLTIPASVTDIDGACFHGCESLESVYMLGPASALKTEGSGSGEATFGQNGIFCADHVSDATFYCVEEYLSDYQADQGWSLIDEGGVYDASAGKYGNTLTTIPIEKRVFPTKWVTAIFPYQVDDYKTVFGANTRVAVMDPDAEHTVTTGKEQATGKQVQLYNIVFKLIDTDYIPAGTPVMICAGQQTEYALYSADQQVTEWFRLESTKEHGTPVTATDGAVITMKGKYVPYTMHPWDFYFMYKNKTQDESGNVTYTDPAEVARFYRVPDAENAATVGICRCYWTINMDGVKIDATMAPAKSATFFVDDEVDGIDGIETRINIAGIYDLQGRKLDIDQNDLPQGLYIVNGKKVVKK